MSVTAVVWLIMDGQACQQATHGLKTKTAVMRYICKLQDLEEEEKNTTEDFEIWQQSIAFVWLSPDAKVLVCIHENVANNDHVVWSLSNNPFWFVFKSEPAKMIT